jgi:pimeloyl-ACP methyl ester carboxylesterase
MSLTRTPSFPSPVLRRWVLGLLALCASACTTPITIEPLDLHEAHSETNQSALAGNDPSEMTRTALRARGLLARFENDPEGVLAELHQIVRSGQDVRRDIFALAEASFLHGYASGKREYLLASAIYSLAFLFPGNALDLPGRFDSRTRLATEIYNSALVEAFRSRDGLRVELAEGVYPLPFGELELSLPPEELVWAGRQLSDLMPIAELRVNGIRNRYRRDGLGAALAARSTPLEGAKIDTLTGPRVRVSLSALLWVDDPHTSLAAERVRGRLEIFAENESEAVELQDEQVPLRYENTAALAATLAQPAIWNRELAGFFGRATGDELPALRAIFPHAPGKTPVVFVHGTASSPGRWADMFNDLWSSSFVRQRYEAWFFAYDTGNPVTFSGAGLRKLLQQAVEQLDPQASDPCLREMVVIGHSQGGLLTKLTSVDTGDRLWNAVSRKPLDELSLTPETREIMRDALFVQHLPFVRRVVFIATPHRGSYQAMRSIAGWVTRFVRMPQKLFSVAGDLAKLQRDGLIVATNVRGVPTSVDNMREGNPFLKALVQIPIAAGIASHSIIPVLGNGPVEDGKDGVVAYRSAHIDGVGSELVVQSGHSAQAEPATIEEVRRILDVHSAELTRKGLSCGREAGPAVP